MAPVAQTKSTPFPRWVGHVGRFVRLWVAAFVAQIAAGSSLSLRVVCIAAAVGLIEVLYRVAVPTLSLSELQQILSMVTHRGKQ